MEYANSREKLERALDFVESNGSRPMRAMAANVTGQMGADTTLAELVTAYQNSDGGWHSFDSDLQAPLSTISQTWIGLWRLLSIDPGDSSPLDRTVDFLRQTQQKDGSWDEAQEILRYHPPRWMVPGSKANQIWLTSAICRNLFEHHREADVRFEQALAFLRAGWDGDRFPDYIQPHWMALALFSRIRDQSSVDREIAQGCERFLSDQLSQGHIDPLDAVDVAHAAFKAGPLAVDLYRSAFEYVLESQADDGGWITHYGDRHRVLATVSAMYLLKMVPPPAATT